MAMFKCTALLLASALPGLAFPVSDSEQAPAKYIIRLKDGATDLQSHLNWVSDVHRRSLSRRDTTGIEKTFTIGSFNAYSGEFDSETLGQIQQNDNVAVVEEDKLWLATNVVTQTDAPWGIASLSQENLPNSNTLGQTYTYDESAGEGVWAYVFDTGVLTNNTQFEGRAIKGYNPWSEESFDDYFGHGSHVAGIIASKTFGVAKKATIVDVKAARSVGYSTVSKVLECLEWTVNNITNTPGRLSKHVINVSLAFPASTILNDGFDAATAKGIMSVVGAANDNKDASTKSPAGAASVVTVGGTAWNKTRANWSNFGPRVDIFAPGLDIPSLWNKEGVVSTVSGTSMSSPHVAGLVAYLRGKEDLGTPQATIDRVLELAQKNVVGDPGAGSPNVLAFHGGK